MCAIKMNTRTWRSARFSWLFLLVIGGVLGPAPSVSRASDAPDAAAIAQLGRRLNDLLDSHHDPKVRLTARVVDLTSGAAIYERNADTPLIPASNMKLMVMSAAIDRLGSDYQFTTSLSIRGKDLVVVGGGDPSFGDEKLCQQNGQAVTAVFHEWAAKLKAAGVKQVSGNIVIDDSIFDRQFVHPNWPSDQFQAWYEAPIGGLNICDNCVDVVVRPAAPGKPAILSFSPGNTFLQLVNQTTSGGKQTVSVRRKRDSDSIIATGSVARPATLGPITVSDPGLFFGSAFKTTLAAKGIKVLGKVVREKVKLGADRLPEGGHVIAVHSAPIVGALQRSGRNSLGMMAEGLMKAIGAHKKGVGSWATGREALSEFFAKVGVSPGQYAIDDGSGLSRSNKVSARAATQVLAYMYRASGGAFEVLKSSLATPGDDGTLKRRLRGPLTKDRVFAKTGYINGVRTLAGYVQTQSGRWLAFAVFFNGSGKTRPLTAIQDKTCEVLAAWPKN